jgi:hypothetical protein
MRKKILLSVAVAMWLLIGLLLAYDLIYKPIKFRYLISRVEAAGTAAEEAQAFTLAANSGRIWKISRLRTQDWPANHSRPQSDWLVRLEWLESSPYGGAAYVAFRGVIDTNNLSILWNKKY